MRGFLSVLIILIISTLASADTQVLFDWKKGQSWYVLHGMLDVMNQNGKRSNLSSDAIVCCDLYTVIDTEYFAERLCWKIEIQEWENHQNNNQRYIYLYIDSNNFNLLGYNEKWDCNQRDNTTYIDGIHGIFPEQTSFYYPEITRPSSTGFDCNRNIWIDCENVGNNDVIRYYTRHRDWKKKENYYEYHWINSSNRELTVDIGRGNKYHFWFKPGKPWWTRMERQCATVGGMSLPCAHILVDDPSEVAAIRSSLTVNKEGLTETKIGDDLFHGPYCWQVAIPDGVKLFRPRFFKDK